MIDCDLAEEIKKVQLELVKEIDRICAKYKLRYYLAYGTLIGAIRHNGFIPWDDDIDIMMPHEDMTKFFEVSKLEMDLDKFFCQSPETESEYKLTINRVRKNNTTMLESSFVGKKVHTGIFVDIYPLFGAAPSGVKRKIQVVRAMLRALYLLGEPVKNHGKLMNIGSSILLKFKSEKSKNKKQQKLFNKISKYSFNNSQFVTVLDSGVKEMSMDYKLEWFGEGIYHQFEDIKLKVPVDSDSVLRKYFGDYMVLPPIEERHFHHDYVEIDLKNGNSK